MGLWTMSIAPGVDTFDADVPEVVALDRPTEGGCCGGARLRAEGLTTVVEDKGESICADD